MAADDSEKLREFFAEQKRLGGLRSSVEDYTAKAEQARREFAELAKESPETAEKMKGDYDRAIAGHEANAKRYDSQARELDAHLMAEWKANAHLMGGLEKGQADELAKFQAEKQQKLAADRLRAEQEVKDKAERDAKEKADRAAAEANERAAREDKERKQRQTREAFDKTMREAEEARRRREHDKDPGRDR